MAASEPQPGAMVCPSEADLREFSRGLSAAESVETIGQHLTHCTPCSAVLARLIESEADADGRIVRALRDCLSAPLADPFGSDPECRRMTEQAKRLFTSQTSPDELALPMQLDAYELVAKIGEGGMGTVYRGLHRHLKKPVAVKVLRVDRTADPRAVARFQREMAVVGRLDHPHLVRATDAGEVGGVHFLVMELLDGLNLARLVQYVGPLQPADACALIRQAAEGLAAAHGLVHRDLKPSNVLLTRAGSVKVLDLGLARLQEDTQPMEDLTTRHQVLGTGDYMAPEQWLGSHTVDARADIYSLGCTLYFLLTGTALFTGPSWRTPRQKMAAHLHAEPPWPTLGRLPRGLLDILQRMLAKEAEQRFAGPGALAEALAPHSSGADLAALAGRGLARHDEGRTRDDADGADSTGAGSPATPPEAVARLPRPPRRARRRVVLVACGALLLATALFAAPLVAPRVEPNVEPNLALPAARVFKAGRWHNLLDRPPTPWHWFNPAGNSDYRYHADAQTLFVQSVGTSLFSLGEAKHPGFTLQLRVRQLPWTGGVGVFFAGHKDPDTGMLRYQYIELCVGPKQGTLILERKTGSVEPRPNLVPLLRQVGVGTWFLPELPGPREYELEIRVERAGLTRVRWDGAPCAELVDKLGQAAPGTTYQGEFGLICVGSAATITHAKMLPTE